MDLGDSHAAGVGADQHPGDDVAQDQRLAEALIPFFVTRQIYAGAGKVLQTPRGFHYCLSQRAQHICQEISGATTSSRSIINTRDEPHADAERYRRLHVIVGDSNMSEMATYLKIGTTAIVLDMIEDGFFDRDYSLQSPVQAIRDISHDPTLHETVKLKDGRAISALELQIEYLEYATRYVQSIDADDITRDVLARWTDDTALSTRINPQVAHYTGQAELAAVIQEGLKARDAGGTPTVWVHVDTDRDGRVSRGDYVTVQSYPASPQLRVVVKQV